VKLYAATVELALPKEKEKTEVWPPLNANVFYSFESHPIYDQTQGSSAVFLTL
jgi:hypothetical protein